jgi:Fe-S cluster biogenesis protein NfuA
MTIETKLELTEKVQNVIEQIRPYLQADGGDIQFVELTEDLTVKVELQGACGSCPYSLMTLKNGVEQAVIKAIPEIKSVDSI